MLFEILSVTLMTKVVGGMLFLFVPPFRRLSLLCMRSLWAILLAVGSMVGLVKLLAIMRRRGRQEDSP